LKDDAGSVLEQRRVQSDLELLLEARLNEEDLDRCNAKMRAEAADRDARYMRLFADFQMQKTHLARAMGDLRALQLRKDELEGDKGLMTSAIKLLEV
jgi:hypothetical protein